jgi:protocatechuate 3,4-dioxygenase beta subunit
MKRSRLALAALAALTFFAWRTGAWVLDEGDPGPALGGGNRSVEPESRAPSGAPDRAAAIAPRADGAVTISGTVVDAATRDGVGGVEVVFRGEGGEESIMAGPDGRYRIAVRPGAYRAFVRDDAVLSIGRAEVRLPDQPSADAAGAPDEALMPLVVARASASGVDLTVARGGVVRGQVIDRSGRPVASAVLRARSGGPRPALGTDVVETGADGSFELRLPPGGYAIEVSHARFAGIAGPEDERRIAIAPGDVVTRTFTLAAGCVIAGRVVRPGGAAAGEGAIEARYRPDEHQFAAAGRIAADGTFRWATTDEAEIELRAWPWKSPPSPERAFACHDGARYEGVVFELPQRGPDLDGVLVDHTGAPVPLAYIDVMPAEGGSGQVERTDEQGRWSVYQLEPGGYVVTAHAAGRGVVAQAVTAPAVQVRLELGGTGRIAGRTPRIENGSFELVLARCSTETASLRLPGERRLVAVTDHVFTVEDVPACELDLFASWRGQTARERALVTAGGAAELDLEVGPARMKQVRGTVTDEDGRPIASAQVKAMIRGEAPVFATADEGGRYEMRAAAGAMIYATGQRGANSYRGRAEVDEEDGGEAKVDIQLEALERSDDEPAGDEPEGGEEPELPEPEPEEAPEEDDGPAVVPAHPELRNGPDEE